MNTLQIICGISILLNLFFLSGLFFAKDVIKRLRNSNEYFRELYEEYKDDFLKSDGLYENQKKISNKYKSQVQRRNKRIENLELKLESCKK